MSEAPVQPVYLVKGDDPSLVAQAVQSLLQDLVGDRARDQTVEEIADDAALDVALDACQTPSFLTDRRVVVVRNAGRFRADEVEPLVAYLSSPMTTSSLVLVSGGGAIPTRVQKAVKQAGHIIDASVPGGKGRQMWLTERLRKAPVKVDRGASDLIADRLSEEFGQLDGVLDALAAAFGEGATVTAAQVEPFLGAGGAAAPWELTDAIDSGDTETALTQLRRMLEGGGRHPLVVAATLQRHVTTMLRLDGSDVTSEAEAAALLGIAPYPAKKALAQTRRLGSPAVRRAVKLVADADIDLRGRKAWSSELTLEVLVARLSKLAPARRSAARSSR